jgi:hypothetical protein
MCAPLTSIVCAESNKQPHGNTDFLMGPRASLQRRLFFVKSAPRRSPLDRATIRTNTYEAVVKCRSRMEPESSILFKVPSYLLIRLR